MPFEPLCAAHARAVCVRAVLCSQKFAETEAGKEEEEEDFSRRSSTQSFYLVDQREINQEENCIERASNSSSSL